LENKRAEHSVWRHRKGVMGKVAQIAYTHVSKYKIDKIKFKKMFPKGSCVEGLIPNAPRF
jgi:hypothetical protein